jgi:hypothetical protein
MLAISGCCSVSGRVINVHIQGYVSLRSTGTLKSYFLIVNEAGGVAEWVVLATLVFTPSVFDVPAM